jgi:hypothetical protein
VNERGWCDKEIDRDSGGRCLSSRGMFYTTNKFESEDHRVSRSGPLNRNQSARPGSRCAFPDFRADRTSNWRFDHGSFQLLLATSALDLSHATVASIDQDFLFFDLLGPDSRHQACRERGHPNFEIFTIGASGRHTLRGDASGYKDCTQSRINSRISRIHRPVDLDF